MRVRAKLALGLAAVLAGLVLVAAWLSWLGMRETVRTGMSQQLHALAGYAAGDIDSDLNDVVATTRAVAASLPDAALGSVVALERHMGLLPMPMGPIHLCIAVAPDGRALAQYPLQPPLGNVNFSNRDYFRKVLETHEPAISRPFRGEISGMPVVAVAVPRFDDRGRLFLVMNCSFNLLHHRVFSQARSSIGRSGYMYIATRDRTIVLHPDATHILAPAPPHGANPAADRAEEGFEGTLLGTDSSGQSALMSFSQLKSVNWFVAAAYPMAEVDQPITESRNRLLVFTLLALGASLLCAWLFAGLLVQPVERLTRHLKRLGGRADRSLPPLPRRNDEIGELAESFNGLLRTLQERETKLKLSEEKFAKVFHASPDGILIARLEDGMVLDFNESYERLLGYSRDESVGRTTAELGVWVRPEQCRDFIEEVSGEAASPATSLRSGIAAAACATWSPPPSSSTSPACPA